MQIVLSPVDPSQSARSCLNTSALDPRGSLIHPDSPPRELMGGEAAHSTHVTQSTDRQWGAADGEGKKGAVGGAHANYGAATAAVKKLYLLFFIPTNQNAMNPHPNRISITTNELFC